MLVCVLPGAGDRQGGGGKLEYQFFNQFLLTPNRLKQGKLSIEFLFFFADFPKHFGNC